MFDEFFGKRKFHRFIAQTLHVGSINQAHFKRKYGSLYKDLLRAQKAGDQAAFERAVRENLHVIDALMQNIYVVLDNIKLEAWNDGTWDVITERNALFKELLVEGLRIAHELIACLSAQKEILLGTSSIPVKMEHYRALFERELGLYKAFAQLTTRIPYDVFDSVAKTLESSQRQNPGRVQEFLAQNALWWVLFIMFFGAMGAMDMDTLKKVFDSYQKIIAAVGFSGAAAALVSALTLIGTKVNDGTC